MPGERALLPLFPLGMVLVPGLVLPLNIFENRYRTLVNDLLALPPEQRRFGVIAIRQGREVGTDDIPALYEIGTTAIVTQVRAEPDGRFSVLSLGADRFRLRELDTGAPYLRGHVEVLPDLMGDEQVAEQQATVLLETYWRYLAALSAARGVEFEVPTLPAHAAALAWLVAATAVVDLPVRQRLLEISTAQERIAAELALLRNELGLLRVTAAAPLPDLIRAPQSPN